MYNQNFTGVEKKSLKEIHPAVLNLTAHDLKDHYSFSPTSIRALQDSQVCRESRLFSFWLLLLQFVLIENGDLAV